MEHNLPILHKGRGIRFSRPKDTKKPYIFGVPKEFPDITRKLTTLYKFFIYDVTMGEKGMDDYFSRDEIIALGKFVKNPTIDNLGLLPIPYGNYLTKYDNYIKILQERQEKRDLERWRRLYK